jgi:hypothetical protein
MASQRRTVWMPRRRSREASSVDLAYRFAEHGRTLSRLSDRMISLRARRTTGLQLRATLQAYDQTLLLAAADAGLELPGSAPLKSVDRLLLEAELSLVGLRWTTAP